VRPPAGRADAASQPAALLPEGGPAGGRGRVPGGAAAAGRAGVGGGRRPPGPVPGRGKLERSEEGRSGTHSRRLRGYRLYPAVDTATGQVITFSLTRGRARAALLAAAFARRLRRLLGRRLAGLVADCGFTSRASLAAPLETGVPFIPGFARSAPVRARLAALSGRQRRWLSGGGGRLRAVRAVRTGQGLLPIRSHGRRSQLAGQGQQSWPLIRCPTKLRGDGGREYPSHRRTPRCRGIMPVIGRRGAESSERPGRHRWAAGRTLAWLLRSRRFGTRNERRGRAPGRAGARLLADPRPLARPGGAALAYVPRERHVASPRWSWHASCRVEAQHGRGTML
jgi:hypothetical protein